MPGLNSERHTEQLLFMLGEELKQPLTTIAQMAELEGRGEIIQVYAQKALRTIDNILLYQGLISGQISLKLEPVHVGGVVRDVAELMAPLMQAQACFVELDIQSSLQTADIDRKLLNGALQSLWQAVLGSLESPSKVICRVQRIQRGIRVSVLSSGANLEGLSLGSTQPDRFSAQPFKAIAGPSTDLLAASSMFELVGRKLTKTNGGELRGLGVTLVPSRQLQLV